MEESNPWEIILSRAEKKHKISVVEIIQASWEIYKPKAFVFSGLTFLIFASYIVSLILFGQIGWIISYFIVSPCLYVGFAIFTKLLRESPEAPNKNSALFGGFQEMFSLGLVAMATYLLLTASLAPTIILLNNAGLSEILAEIQAIVLSQEEVDLSNYSLELSTFNQIVIFSNIIFAVYLQVSFLWAPLLVFFKKVPFYQGIEGSRKLITPIWLKVFGLFISLWLIYIIASFIISMLLAFLGPIFAFLTTIGMVVGLLIVIPISFISNYLIFESVVE